MISFYEGDPRLCLDENGSRLVFEGGQPVMDPGLENLALISLFTLPGWVGNDLFNDPDQQIGSDFITVANQAITLSALTDITNAAVQALQSDAFGKLEVTVLNPNGYRIDVNILIQPPGSDVGTLLLSKNGLNWQAQALSENETRCP